jgi:hypothetical protein
MTRCPAEIARRILSEELDILTGLRELCCAAAKDEEVYKSTPLMFLRGIESDFDIFPSIETRNLYTSKYLEELDIRLGAYLAEARCDILSACQTIVDKGCSNCGSNPKTGVPFDDALCDPYDLSISEIIAERQK